MPNNWLNKIRSHQATPPQGVWMNIANELDKENETGAVDLKTKMYNYQSIPPTNALSNIFAILDKEETQAATSFTERIYNYQQQAPASAWQNIINDLDKSEAKIVPLTNNTKNRKAIYFRMAAAASVIAVIATTIWFSSRNADNPTSPIASVPSETKQPVTAEIKKENAALPASDPQEKKLPQETIAQTQTEAKKDVQKKTASSTAVTAAPDYVKSNPTISLADDPTKGSNEKLQNTDGSTTTDIALMNTANTYISITGPDGQSVKVSSKFSNVLNYLNGENPDNIEYLDKIISESAQWRKTFAQWREKMTNNAVAPSFSNFMDIISLSEILEEKK
jgi:hypothetical protein